MTDWGRKLIAGAIGPRRGHENVKAYQNRAAAISGIGLSSIVKLWKGDYASRKTLSTFHQMAADNAKELASRIENLAADLESGNRSDAETLRDMARRARNCSRGAGPKNRGE